MSYNDDLETPNPSSLRTNDLTDEDHQAINNIWHELLPVEPPVPDPWPPYLSQQPADLQPVELPPQPPPPQLQQLPYVKIIVQPERRNRFRYARELNNRKQGSIKGVHSTPAMKTYPKIRIHHTGLTTALVVVSCVTSNEPYKVHAHKLFGPDTRDGLCVRMCKLTESNELELNGLGIHRAKRAEVRQALDTRATVRIPEVDPNLQIDPFGYGFNHDMSDEELHEVRLAFQVFSPISSRGWQLLPPVVSDPILNENAPEGLLSIKWVSDFSGTFAGGQTVVIEVDQMVELNKTEVEFYENDGVKKLPLWRNRSRILRTDFTCITIKTPPCGRMSNNVIIAYFRVLSDNRRSAPCQFQYILDHLNHIPQGALYGEQEPGNKRRFQPMARFPAIRIPKYEPDLSNETKQDSFDEEKSFDSTEEESDNSGEDDTEHQNDSSGRDDSEDSSEDSIYEALAQLFIDSNNC